MGSRALLAVVVLVACNGDGSGSSTTGTDTGTTSEPTSDALVPGDSTSDTTSSPDFPPQDPLDLYPSCVDGPCPAGSHCIQLDGASICGPMCAEYGPGYAPGRCPDPQELKTLCPLTEEVPGICILGCATAMNCPDPGMVCVECPEPFTDACLSLNNFIGFEGSGSMCVWPNP